MPILVSIKVVKIKITYENSNIVYPYLPTLLQYQSTYDISIKPTSTTECVNRVASFFLSLFFACRRSEKVKNNNNVQANNNFVQTGRELLVNVIEEKKTRKH